VKSKFPPSEFAYRAQVAALPVRIGIAGDMEVLLIRSRETRRWIIPKGWPMKGRKDHQAAAKEAFEEAGVIGKVGKHPVGGYTYQKRLNDRVQPCRVMVYRLDVEHELGTWPEKDKRERQWFPAVAAADCISEPRLASMILRLEREARDDQGLIAKASN
jgi:8-oxo-dGTP pyrophosphatase MutT (NUDIX family)